ncbi:MAG: hypothetical protein ACREQM_20805 [Candidatus Dormibacteraceae bacterium]
MVIGVLGFFAVQFGWFSDGVPQALLAPQPALIAAAIVAAVVLLACSAVLATRLYRRRDL